ncbi:MAG: leucyl/phenylalanyl-tRNA--protein transferase [Ferruginibacter sp.]
MIFQLDDTNIDFPDPALAEEDGLLAVGGDLSHERLLLAYSYGIFPWYSDDEPICWFSPHERCVIFPERIHISKKMRKILQQQTFRISYDEAFDRVIASCKAINRKDQPGTWITDEMEAAYNDLHRSGVAHSVEVWQDEKLAGGIYGLVINKVFCGESMFSEKANASKAALIWLCTDNTFSLIDCQVPNDHLMSMGAEMISREQYLKILRKEFLPQRKD